MTRFAIFLFVFVGSSCAPAYRICMDSQKPMRVGELFFGRDIPGRQPLSVEEWTEFTNSVVAKEFPGGFTVMDGEGQWRDPATKVVINEPTKILVVALPPSSDLASRISRIRDAYRRLYRQISVGVLTYDACGEF